MRSLRQNFPLRFSAAALFGIAITLASANAEAGKFKVVHSFCSKQNCKDGLIPLGPLLMDESGNLFGVTKEGGKNQKGAAYELQRQADGRYQYVSVFSFPVNPPDGGLILDTQGNLYGELSTGEFYKLTYGFGQNHDKWQMTFLQVVCSQQPNCGIDLTGGLTYQGASTGVPWDGASPLYGVAFHGGTNDGGTVFQLTANGGAFDQTALYNFCSQGGSECLDGSAPNGITLDASGNIYGTAGIGGGHDDGNLTGGAGVVFEISPSGDFWTETVLYSFCSAEGCVDGAFPFGGLTIDAAGSLFGATEKGGGHCRPDAAGCGTLFKLLPDGVNSQEVVLYTFCAKKDCKDGRYPLTSPYVDASGNLWGTTSAGGGNDIDGRGVGGGVTYELTTGNSLQVLHAFCSLPNCADGNGPEGGVLDSEQRFFGITARGGEFNSGTVYLIKPQS